MPRLNKVRATALNQRGVIQLVVLLILLLGLVGGVLLVTRGEPLKFLPKAGGGVSGPIGPETSFTLIGPNACAAGFLCTLQFIMPPETGEEFSVKLYARSDIEEANLFTAKINFPKDIVEVKEIRMESRFNEVENFYDNSSGEISIVGGVPAPGLRTQGGEESALMAAIIFRAKAIGKGTVFFTDASTIYSNLNNIDILTIKRPYDISVEVKPSATPIVSPTPTATPSIFFSTSREGQSVSSGNSIDVTWNVPNASASDYIRVLTAEGDKNVGPLGISPSNDCNLNNRPGSTAVKVGACSFTSAVIQDVGVFKLAYYSSAGALLVTTGTFKIVPASGGTLIASPTTVTTNSKVNLTWSNINNAHPKDYINYLNADDYTGTATSHSYWPSNNCAWSTDSTTPATSGSCSIETPYLTGKFKLVLRSGDVLVGQPAPILAVSNVMTVPSSVATPVPSSGDGNNDGKVNLVDLSILLTDFNKTGGFRPSIDLNGDGVINTFDFSLMRNLLIQKGVIRG